MPVTIRDVDPRLAPYARTHGLRLPAAAAHLITIALDHLEARSAGAKAANAGRSKAERSDAARAAVTARWDRVRAAQSRAEG